MERREADEYRAWLETMPDMALRTEWGREEPGVKRFLIEQEMAKRFRKPSPQQQYYINKFLELPAQFMDAYGKGEWTRAKQVYDRACTLSLFLEIPVQLSREFFGYTDDDEGEVRGMIPRDLVDQVIYECVVRDKLGFECMVYRVPGEAGFYGAKPRPDARHMVAEENPSYRIQEMEAQRSG